jgi:hypothetical protein
MPWNAVLRTSSATAHHKMPSGEPASSLCGTERRPEGLETLRSAALEPGATPYRPHIHRRRAYRPRRRRITPKAPRAEVPSSRMLEGSGTLPPLA